MDSNFYRSLKFEVLRNRSLSFFFRFDFICPSVICRFLSFELKEVQSKGWEPSAERTAAADLRRGLHYSAWRTG